MTKFDSLVTDLFENNGFSNTINKPGQPQANMQQNTSGVTPNNNQPGATTTTQPSNQQKPATTPVPATNTATKPNYDQLMKDFNDPNAKITNINDLKKYGFTIN
jgi:hypothetical protein